MLEGEMWKSCWMKNGRKLQVFAAERNGKTACEGRHEDHVQFGWDGTPE